MNEKRTTIKISNRTTEGGTIRLGRKRVIIVPAKSESKKQQQAKRPSRPKAKQKPAPSIEKGKEIDSLLKNSSRTWRDYAPITRDGSFEKEARKLAEEKKIYLSKVLLEKVIKKHKTDKRYISKMISLDHRQGFHGNKLEPITQAEKSSATARLNALVKM